MGSPEVKEARTPHLQYGDYVKVCELKECNTKHTNPKFCSRSCSAKVSNIGKQRNKKYFDTLFGEKEERNCRYCGNIFFSRRHKTTVFCNEYCWLKHHRIPDNIREEHFKAKNRYYAMRHYEKYYDIKSQIVGNEELIKVIYLLCPKGFDVDHIIPISRGGKTHEDNLRYMWYKDNRYVKNNSLDEELEPKVFESLEIIPWEVILHEHY